MVSKQWRKEVKTGRLLHQLWLQPPPASAEDKPHWALWDVPPNRHIHSSQTFLPPRSPAGNSKEPCVRKPHIHRLTASSTAQIFVVFTPMIKSFQQRKKTLLCSLLVIGFSISHCGGGEEDAIKANSLKLIVCLLLSRVISWQLTKHTDCKKPSWIFCKTSVFYI